MKSNVLKPGHGTRYANIQNVCKDIHSLFLCPQGYVHDYNGADKKLFIKYPDDWKQPEWIDITSVRPAFDASLYSSWRPSENEEVECKARAEEREPYGWWPCKAKRYGQSSNGEEMLYSVGFVGWGDQHNEILALDYIRKKSPSKCLSARNMHKEVYNVDNELKQWVLTQCANGSLLHTLMPHKNISSQIIHIAYLEKQSKLMLIGSKRVLTTMKDIIYCFFEKQKALLKLEQTTKELETRSRKKKELEAKSEKWTFKVHPLLSGYLRGARGSNIQNVRKRIPNILNIKPQNGSCYISARDKQSLNLAIDQLHIVCKKVIIPREEMAQIIGKQGKQIQDIKNKSRVIKIISWVKWADEFCFVLCFFLCIFKRKIA